MRWINKQRYAETDLVNGISIRHSQSHHTATQIYVWGFLISANLTRYFWINSFACVYMFSVVCFLRGTPTTCFFISLAFRDWKTSRCKYQRTNALRSNANGDAFFCVCHKIPFFFHSVLVKHHSFGLCRSVFHLCDTCQVVTCICYFVMCMHSKYSTLTRWDRSNCNEIAAVFYTCFFSLLLLIVMSLCQASYRHRPNGSICSVNIHDGRKNLINMHHSCCFDFVSCSSLSMYYFFCLLYNHHIPKTQWIKCILSLFLCVFVCLQLSFVHGVYSIPFICHAVLWNTINSNIEQWHTK